MADTDMNTKGLLVSLLYMDLYIDYMNDINQPVCDSEQFAGSINSSINHDETKTNRHRMIDLLNRNRYREGRFFMPCECCDKRTMKNIEYKRSPTKKHNPNIDIDSQNLKLDDHCNVLYGSNKHDGGMSFYNSKYVDTTKTNCYGCIINVKDKMISKIQHYGDEPVISDYIFWPTLESPINGAPYI